MFASCSEPSRLARGPQDETLTLALLSRTALEFDRVRAALRPPVPAGVAKAMDPSGPVFEKHPAWPRYPREAAARGIQGTVVVEALVGADGRVAGAHVLYGVDGLDAAAVAWARTCEFSPARENGTAVSVAVPITVAFQHDR